MDTLHSIKPLCEITSLRVSWLGRICYSLRRHSQSLAIKNINTIFEHTLSPYERNHLAKAYYSHIITSLKECIWLRCLSAKKLESKVEIQGLHYFLDAAKQKKGIILLTGHLGSWEFTPVIGIPTIREFPGRFHVIRKPLRFKFLKSIFHKPWSNHKMRVIDHKNALIKSVKALRKNDAVLFVFDQRAREPHSFLLNFLKKPAETYSSLAHLVQHLHTPVLPVTTYRQADEKHIIEFYPQIIWATHPDMNEALKINTQQYNRTLEKMILKNPEQWLWSYKRWKFNE